jgi:3-methylcrotonyl-CoA carboxylase alpha subunit
MSQAVAVAVAARLRAEMPDQVGWQDPWSKRNHWRMQGSAHRVWMWEFAGQRIETVLTTEVRQGMQLRIDNPSASFEWFDTSECLQVRWGEHTWHAHAYVLDEKVHVFSDQGEAVCRWIDPLAHASQEGVASGHLGAPMPGKLLSYAVAIGERVAAGQALAVMEAMKMEHTVSAPNPGVVTELCFAPGDQVPEGAMLLQLKID